VWRFVWALIVVAGCIEPQQLGRCEELLCPANTGCWSGDGSAMCVPNAALVACRGQETGASCVAQSGAAGSCHAGACFAITCGDGWLDDGEVCDDGNRSSGDGCSIDCVSTETCGNGYVDAALGEACDDENLAAGDGCQPTCQLARCGDGFIDPVEECDDGAANSNDANAACRTNCQARRCGDGIVDASEVCDDGDQVSGDGCSFDCASNETCGNGEIDFFAGETCDDAANHVGHDGCTDACAAETALWGELVTTLTAQLRTQMVFDSDRNVMVQLASSTDGTDRLTTWEYDGVA
jgi:cysteine-rich repeat protein